MTYPAQESFFRSKRRFVLPAVLLAIVAGAGYWVWSAHVASAPGGSATPGSGAGAGGPGGRRGGGSGKDSQPVSVQAARKQDLRVSVSAIGSIAASNTAVVRAQVSGVLQSLQFQEGQQIQSGQPLALIDPRAFQATLGQAEGALARDTAQLENAKLDLARYRDLLTKDAVAKQQLDTQQALVRQLEGTVKVDQGAVASAQLQLTYTRVLAPISGRAGLKQADLGNVVSASDANGIVVITQTRPISMVFAVPAAQVPLIMARLHAKQPLAVEAWDRDGNKQLATGRVSTIDNAIDATTDTIKVKALFANTDDALFPNQSVSVRLLLDTQKDMLAVPQAAVQRGSQGFYVYVVNPDNTVSSHVVKPGVVDKNWMAVEGDVQPGDKVVVDGVDRLRNGAKVEIIDTAARQRTGKSADGSGKPRGGASSAAAAQASASSSAAPASATTATTSPPAAGIAAAPAAPVGDADADKRKRFFESLSPEDQAKLKAMTPEERKAWREQHRPSSN